METICLPGSVFELSDRAGPLLDMSFWLNDWDKRYDRVHCEIEDVRSKFIDTGQPLSTSRRLEPLAVPHSPIYGQSKSSVLVRAQAAPLNH